MSAQRQLRRAATFGGTAAASPPARPLEREPTAGPALDAPTARVTRSRPQAVAFEACCDSLASVIAARVGGAARVELCSALSEGGLTPSVGLMRAARRALPDVRLHVLLRPRPGDFSYDDSELAIMLDDMDSAESAGADGVVAGCLHPNGTIDAERLQRLTRRARDLGLEFTFHRAMDFVRDVSEALATLMKLGVGRVLTSGRRATAAEGAEAIAALVMQAGRESLAESLTQSLTLCIPPQAGSRIVVVAGGGVTALNAASLVRATGVRELHGSAGAVMDSGMSWRPAAMDLSGMGGTGWGRRVCSATTVAAIVAAANAPSAA